MCPVIRKLQPAPCTRGIHLCPHVFITVPARVPTLAVVRIWCSPNIILSMTFNWYFVAAPSDVIQRQNGRPMIVHGICILTASISDKSWQKCKEYVFRHSVNVDDGCWIIIQIYTAFSKSHLSIFRPLAVSVFIHCVHKPIYRNAITQPMHCVLNFVLPRYSLHIQRTKHLALNETYVMLCNNFFMLSNLDVEIVMIVWF